MGKIVLLTYDTRESRSISAALKSNKYAVWQTRTVEETCHTARKENPDLFIIDVPSPTISFHRLKKSLAHDIPFAKIPFIIFLPENTAEIKILKMAAAVEFLSKPFEVNTLLKKTAILIEAKKRAEKETSDLNLHRTGEEEEVLEFKKIIENIEEESDQSREEIIAFKNQIKESYIETGKMIVELVEERDIFEKGHSTRVSEYSDAIGKKLRLPDKQREQLIHAALLHDIGKIFINPAILGKPSALTEWEYEVIRSHPIKGQRLLQSLTDMETIATTILLHHEQPNGKGYYRKKSGEAPKLSKIIAVAEAFDAMTTARIMGRHMTVDEALQELKKGKGKKYDEASVEALISHIKQRDA